MSRKDDVAWVSSFTVSARVPSPRKGSIPDLRDALWLAARPETYRVEGPGGDGIIRVVCGAYLEDTGAVDPEQMVDRVARVIHKFTGRPD